MEWFHNLFTIIKSFVSQNLPNYIYNLIAVIILLIIIVILLGPLMLVILKTVCSNFNIVFTTQAFSCNQCKCDSLISDWAALATVVVTIFATYFAYRAFRESVLSRKQNAFSDMFTQLIDLQKGMFTKGTLNETKFACKKDFRLNCTHQCNYGVNTKNNTFDNFRIYYENRTKGQNLSIDLIKEIWEGYYLLIYNKSDFSQCFKYIYHEIDTILKNAEAFQGNRETMIYYAKLIQSTMSKDELFCYLINLLVFFQEHDCSDATSKAHLRLLSDARFFEDICRINSRDNYENLTSEIYKMLSPNHPSEQIFVELVTPKK